MKLTKKRIGALLLCVVMLLSLLGCAPKEPKPNTDGNEEIVIPEIEDVPKEATEINVLDYGVDNTGEKDMTGLLTALHNKSAETGLPVYYPNGVYMFNGATLDFSGGVEFESTDQVIVCNSNSRVPIFNFDDAGNFIGLMQNHLELQYGQDEWKDSGSLLSPPLSEAEYETKVDLLAYWYNDFGLKSTAIAQGRNGWLGNFDWRWNHSDCEDLGTELQPYDPYNAELHPLLGYYRGDDPVVLDWICYWLREYGIDQTAPFVGVGLNAKNWEDPACSYHWIYQLLENTPNAKGMDFAFFLESSSYSANFDRVKQSWWRTFDTFYFNKKYKDMVYCYEEDDKRYPVVMLWDETSFVYSWDDPSLMLELYLAAGEAFQDKGYDGVCIMANSSAAEIFLSEEQRIALAEAGVKWLACDYSGNALASASDYKGRVDAFYKLQQIDRVYGVATGLNSHVSNDAGYAWGGSNALDFGRWLSKAVKATLENEERAKIVTCYNVSEWTEGGHSLIPTVASRFSYLDAVKRKIVVGMEDEDEDEELDGAEDEDSATSTTEKTTKKTTTTKKSTKKTTTTTKKTTTTAKTKATKSTK